MNVSGRITPPARTLLAVVVLSLLCAASGSAQTLTGAIVGTVVDEGNLPLPGVSIVAQSPQLIGQPEVRVTNEHGEYRLPALPPGAYTLRFELAGFTRLNREEILIRAGTTVTINAKLRVAAVEETITVQGSAPLVDVKGSQRQETMTEEVLQATPVRLYVDAYQLMPGVVDGQYRAVTPGASSVHGSTSKQNHLNLDGANLDDTTAGYPATDISPEIIEEMQITTSGISAEFAGAGGAVINVITKSGSNQFSGAVTGFFSSDALQSSNITDELRSQGVRSGTAEKKRWTAGATFGGPVIKDRLWFFSDYQKQHVESTIIDFPWLNKERQDLTFVKLSSQPAVNHRVDGFFQYAFKYQNPAFQRTTWKDDKVVNDGTFFTPVVNVRWTNTLNSTTFLETNAGLTNLKWNAGWPNVDPSEVGYVDRATGYQFGGIYRGHGNPVRRYSRRAKADISHHRDRLVLGSHDLKAGAMFERLLTRDDRYWGSHGRVMYLLNGVPDRIGFSNYPVSEYGTADTISSYLQDQWSVSRALTLNVGLRFEHTEYWFPETQTGGLNFPVQTFREERDVASFRTLAPRLGAVYDLFGDQRTVVKAHWGRYYNQIASRDFINVAKFREGQRINQWLDSNGDLQFQDNELGRLISDNTVVNPAAIDPDLDPAYWQSFTIGVQREIVAGTSVSATGIFKKEFDIIETIDAGLPFDEAYLPVTVPNPLDGTPITVYALQPAFQGRAAQSYVTNPARLECSFCSEPPTRNYRGLELTVNRRMSDRWQLHGSYVWSRAQGNLGTSHFSMQQSLYSNPNNLVNAWGRTSLDKPHQLKVIATFNAPFGLWLSGVYVGQSGVPYQEDQAILGRQVALTTVESPLLAFERIIIVRGEAPGTVRMPAQHLVSMRAEKRFTVGAERRVLGIVLDATNLFNSSAATYMLSARVGHPNFDRVGALVLPRTVRLGLRVNF